MTDKPKRKVGRPRNEEPSTTANIWVDVPTFNRYKEVASGIGLSFSEFGKRACDEAVKRLCGEDQKCA